MGERVHSERIDLRDAVTRSMRSRVSPCRECHPRGQSFWNSNGVKPHPKPIPLPPALSLFVLGLGGIIALRRRKA